MFSPNSNRGWVGGKHIHLLIYYNIPAVTVGVGGAGSRIPCVTYTDYTLHSLSGQRGKLEGHLTGWTTPSR